MKSHISTRSLNKNFNKLRLQLWLLPTRYLLTLRLVAVPHRWGSTSQVLGGSEYQKRWQTYECRHAFPGWEGNSGVLCPPFYRFLHLLRVFTWNLITFSLNSRLLSKEPCMRFESPTYWHLLILGIYLLAWLFWC